MLWKLQTLGFTAVLLEAESDVGGCWYANRYPGARCDVESFAYSYSFSREIEDEWRWTERYPTQAEIQRYQGFVVDRLNLRNRIRFSSRVVTASYAEEAGRWAIKCEDGTAYSSTHLFLATGPLTVPRMPEIAGIDTFSGESYHTARWPKRGVNLTGKRVGLIGTGSSGTQLIPAVTDVVERLYVFVRTPNYVTPARNYPLTQEHRDYWIRNREELRRLCRRSEVGGGGDVLTFEKLRWKRGLDSKALSNEQQQEIMAECWEAGGPAPLIYAFKDVYSDPVVNELVSSFIRSKISEVIQDAEVLETLTPAGYPFLAKRPCVADNYYESFTRPNVEAVNLRRHPVKAVTPGGISLVDRDIELDVIVYASGFDAMTGAITSIDIRGRHGISIQQAWRAGPQSYLGMAVAGFPNMFILGGPGSPSVLTNVVATTEFQVDYLGDMLAYAQRAAATVIEAASDAQNKWVTHASQVARGTLFDRADSWYVGANVPGKPRVVLPYAGGSIAYQDACAEVTRDGYRGFVISKS